MKSRGFTLIELLVVIAIIGILATFAVVQFTGARNKAKNAQTQSDLRQMITLIQVAREETGLTSFQITGNTCSNCTCRVGDMRNTTGDCLVDWQYSLTSFINATNGQAAGAEKFIRDPWGSPYALDENEREGGPSDCRRDTIRSLGSDGIYGTSDDVSISLNASDTEIPLSRPCP